MTFFEALFVAGLFFIYVKWHWAEHIKELARRVNELSERLEQLDHLNLEAPHKNNLQLAHQALAKAIQLQRMGKVGDSDAAVAEGNRLADLAESKSSTCQSAQKTVLAA
jgi:hypothetical protein